MLTQTHTAHHASEDRSDQSEEVSDRDTLLYRNSSRFHVYSSPRRRRLLCCYSRIAAPLLAENRLYVHYPRSLPHDRPVPAPSGPRSALSVADASCAS